ncbi:MAG TPA: hypothetical protein VK665_08765 [Candidatus Elarobacter sp.]|nr:hypothetical protein [Candidatus Elarobacter sp.]
MFFTYSPQLRQDIEDALSADRLTAYRNAAGGDLERAIDLYVWNAGTAAAFFGPIGVLEITLRNALDRELSRTFRSPWFDDPAFLRIDANVAGRVRKIKQKLVDRGAAVTQPRVVAELSLGFWVNLLRPGPRGSYVHALWGPALSKAFRPGTRRATVAGHLDRVLRFRNRVAHHEPIFSRDLTVHYASILWVIEQAAPGLVPWVEHHARVPSCITDGPTPPRLRL